MLTKLHLVDWNQDNVTEAMYAQYYFEVKSQYKFNALHFCK